MLFRINVVFVPRERAIGVESLPLSLSLPPSPSLRAEASLAGLTWRSAFSEFVNPPLVQIPRNEVCVHKTRSGSTSSGDIR